MKPTATDGKCTNCGSADLILAEDFTDYSPCEWNAATQRWAKTHTTTQTFGLEDSVRFFCTECGTQHAAPEELK